MRLNAETPLKDVSSSGAISSDSWAWVELNYRPHAYQAASYEHNIGLEVPTRLPFTNILLSMSPIQEHLAHFHEHFAHSNGHHNGHHRIGFHAAVGCGRWLGAPITSEGARQTPCLM